MSLRLIAGKFKGRVLHVPKTLATRPTQGALRESVFNICQAIVEGAEVLDLFAGSGAMGFEALSRGAKHVTFVETNKQALIAIQKNIEMLNVSNQVTILKMDAYLALDRIQQSFDLIYIDPPYTEDDSKIGLRASAKAADKSSEGGGDSIPSIQSPPPSDDFRRFGAARKPIFESSSVQEHTVAILLQKAASRLKPEGTLFIEERYTPEKQAPQGALHLKSSRRFGTSFLHEYSK